MGLPYSSSSSFFCDFVEYVMGIFVFADRSIGRCWERIAFIMLVFKYSMVVSISSFVFSEIEAEVE